MIIPLPQLLNLLQQPLLHFLNLLQPRCQCPRVLINNRMLIFLNIMQNILLLSDLRVNILIIRQNLRLFHQ